MTRTVTVDDIRHANYGPWMGYDAVFVHGVKPRLLRPEFREIGRVPSIECRCRPREGFDAVLLLHIESGDEFWVHVFKLGDGT